MANRWADQAAREAKATDLEQIIVNAGNHHVTLRDGAVCDEVRRCALAELSRRRGKRVTASEETWTLVVTFLRDRFGART
jgi:hypothetical protein